MSYQPFGNGTLGGAIGGMGITSGWTCAQCGQWVDGMMAHQCYSVARAFEQQGWLSQLQHQIQQPTISFQGVLMAYSNNRILIVCNGQVTELAADATLAGAQDKAEQLAHQFQCEAYILKPVRKVAPKRDVVTTDLP